MSGTELVCTGISKSFGTHNVLHDLNLTVAAGTLTAVLGASGSGKTTLLRLIMGFSRGDSGTIAIGDTLLSGHDAHVAPEARNIGYVAQEGALFPHLDVAGNVGFGLPRHERKSGRRVREVLALVGLDESLLSRKPGELSGGQQRRVALARALAPNPKVILLDEPFSGLDAHLRGETRDAVLRALRQQEVTTLLVTHDQAEALSLGREVAVLHDGRMAHIATPREVYESPADINVARFTGETVVLAGVASGSTVKCALGNLALRFPREGDVSVMLRPEQLRLGTGNAKGEVKAIEYFGRQTVVRVTLDDASEMKVGIAGGDIPEIGDEVTVSVHGPVMAYAS